MPKEPVIAIIDVGKTNKKLFLFNQSYEIVYERSARFLETADEDGFPCENVESLKSFVRDGVQEVLRKEAFELKAVNFSTYGASFVYIDERGEPLTPLYNYLKPFPVNLEKTFYQSYGGRDAFASRTASPVLGSLNSGLQLYRIKEENPQIFQKMKFALHLPQYLSYLLTGIPSTDITSVGCHTGLWDFDEKKYHRWVEEERLIDKFAPIHDCDEVNAAASGEGYKVGMGLHDSSAALIPYLKSFKEPFLLISTGTWCISLNPFNSAPLTADELRLDCLSYLQYKGEPAKASRLFAGYEHEEGVKRIALHFGASPHFYKSVLYDNEVRQKIKHFSSAPFHNNADMINKCLFTARDLVHYTSEVDAYHQLMEDIMTQQILSTNLVLTKNVKSIFVDGGFSANSVYMNLLANAFPERKVFAASMAQATALGSALAIHNCWNPKSIPSDLIELLYYKNRT